MIIVNNLSNETLAGSINGKPFSVSYNPQSPADVSKFEKMKELAANAQKAQTMDELKTIIEEFEPLTEENYKTTVETVCPQIVVNKATNRFHLTLNGQVSSVPMPNAFAQKIIKSIDVGVDPSPMVKFWIRLLRNPKMTASKLKLITDYVMAPYTDNAKVAELVKTEGLSEEVARKKATTSQVAITIEGLIAGYKVSRELMTKFALDDQGNKTTVNRYTPTIDPDTGVITYATPDHAEERTFEPAVQGTSGDEFSCGDKMGHIIKVGQVHALDSWDKVDCTDNVACRKGLHVGGLQYIHGYQNEGTVTHIVLIDPMHIGAVCGLENNGDGALRVKQYFVQGTLTYVNKNLYHSSKYAAEGDEEYKRMLDEVVSATALKNEELAKFKADAEMLK